ncbi:MAG: TetR/AcrR family transcriptional regulator [Oscillospiraceae bacterium]|nr:TetR/AcrR family transcriptional regulator [Oscillospiraceae bacterium]
MARNKYPEETVKKILDTAAKLFMEKGYDNTSLQDIIDDTKLSKGAIYHHFRSKEDIFLNICQRIGNDNVIKLSKIRDDNDLTGLEKLRAIFRTSVLCIPNQDHVLSIMPYLVESPKFLAIQVKSILDCVVPDFIQPVLDEGVADGSIKAEDTKALAEVIMIMSDIWLHPLLAPTTTQDTIARCRVFRRITDAIGIDIIDDEITDAYVRYCDKFNKSSR